jgi:hypothetical protein
MNQGFRGVLLKIQMILTGGPKSQSGELAVSSNEGAVKGLPSGLRAILKPPVASFDVAIKVERGDLDELRNLPGRIGHSPLTSCFVPVLNLARFFKDQRLKSCFGCAVSFRH